MKDTKIIRHDIPVWGAHMNTPTYRLIPDQRPPIYRHSIGGKDWRYKGANDVFDFPMILLSIDFHDPHFAQFQLSRLKELPIIIIEEYLYTDLTLSYNVHANGKFISLNSDKGEIANNDSIEKYINSLECISCQLERLPDDQYCIDEPGYWEACDRFLGCSDINDDLSVIRVLGEPVWLEYVVEEICECGRKMDYIVSIGYDVSDNSKYSPGEMFMFLEGGMYFFFCMHCNNVHMNSQSS